jgi:ribosome biogenesis GTPase
MYAIPTVLVFNKQDVYTPKEVAKYEEAVSIYEKLGYTCFLVSAHTGYGTEGLKACMKDKTSLLSGHSGVGKSTLLNYFDPDLHLATQEVSAWSGKGMHTTTSAEIHPLAFGGSIIDTPGIKEFGLVHIEPEEVGHYFVDIRAHMHACKFNDCIHLNIQEKHCAVKRALNKGAIAPSRYHNYDNIVQSIKAINYWER